MRIHRYWHSRFRLQERIEILVIQELFRFKPDSLNKDETQHEVLIHVCNIFSYRGTQWNLWYTFQIVFKNMLSFLISVGAPCYTEISIFLLPNLKKGVNIWTSSKRTRQWTGEVNSIQKRKAFLYLLHHLPQPPTPFLVCSSSYEYCAQITNRLNKVFSIPLQQRPFWSPRGGTYTQNAQQRNPPPTHLLSPDVPFPYHVV